MNNYLITFTFVFVCINLVAYLYRKTDKRFRYIVLAASIPLSILAAYIMVQ